MTSRILEILMYYHVIKPNFMYTIRFAISADASMPLIRWNCYIFRELEEFFVRSLYKDDFFNEYLKNSCEVSQWFS